jgi:hypothetical protein
MTSLTLNQANELRDAALTDDTKDGRILAGILDQLVVHLETPKVVQIISISAEDEVIIALKNDGSLYKSIGGLTWTKLTTP